MLPCTRLKDKAKAVQSSWLPFSRARFTSAWRLRAPDQTQRKVRHETLQQPHLSEFRISCIHVRSVYSLQRLHLNCKICGSIAVCISHISLTYNLTASMNCLNHSLIVFKGGDMSTLFGVPDVPLLLSLQTSHSEDVASRGPPGENASPSVFAFHPKSRFQIASRSTVEVPYT